MKLYFVTFDDSDVVAVEPGIVVEARDGGLSADLGTDVGGATLAMIPLLIPVAGASTDHTNLVSDDSGAKRLLAAGLDVGEETGLSFVAEEPGDDRALVVLSVIQRSPDARTDVAPYGEGVECVGNAFDRPMDRQLLVLRPGAKVEFRRFERGGNYRPWTGISWSGTDLSLVASADGAS